MTAFHPLPRRLNGSESFQIPPSFLIQQSPSARWLPPRLSRQRHQRARGMWGKKIVMSASTKPPKKGTESFRASVIKPANLAWGRVWGWGKHSWADVPFVGLNELAGLGERKAARPDLLCPGPSYSVSLSVQAMPGWRARFIYSTGVHSCWERTASDTHGVLRSKWATLSHAKR